MYQTVYSHNLNIYIITIIIIIIIIIIMYKKMCGHSFYAKNKLCTKRIRRLYRKLFYPLTDCPLGISDHN